MELLTNIPATLGESPVWDSNNHLLYWVDIIGRRVHFQGLEGAEQGVWQLSQLIGSLALRKNDGLILALQDGIYLTDCVGGELRRVSDVESNLPNNRFNDGKCDSSGRFWVGSMDMIAEAEGREVGPVGALYTLSGDMRVTRKLAGVRISNGLGWNSEDTIFYYIDTPTRRVMAFNYCSATGEIGNGREAVVFTETRGWPDGLAVDEAGMLWVAEWNGGCVGRWNPNNGQLLQEVKIPAPKVTSVAFGGENLDELFVTTAAIGENKEIFPHAGALFRFKPGVKGVGISRFWG